MRIHVRLSPKGIETAIKEIEAYKKAVQSRIETLVSRLADMGYQVAKARFTSAIYDGENDVSVQVEKTGTKAVIRASGKAVLFIEFGTGVNYPDHARSPYRRGSYGKGRGANNKGWVYKGVPGSNGIPVLTRKGVAKPGIYRSLGNPPAEAMWGATQTIAENIEQVWREVTQ